MKRLVLVLAAALLGGAFTTHAQVMGFSGKYTAGDTSNEGPSMASLNGRLYIAWKGVNNTNLNVMVSRDHGHSFTNKTTSPETSESAPSLAEHKGKLFISWRGVGNNQLNVAEVALDASGTPRSLVMKYTSGETTTSTPSLMSTGESLFITWRGVDNNQLNVAKVDMK